MNNTTYFLEDIAKYGREFDTQVLSDNQNLTVYDINSFQPRFNCSLFQSVMRVLEIDSNFKIEKGEYITGKLGVKFDRTDFEYITYDNYYISEEPEYDEDTKAYVFTAYDKMIESMIDYDLNVSYPITVRNFLLAICERLGWDTSGIAETFINSETILYEDVYTDTGYTFRDVLDEIAKITCSFPGFYSDVFQLKYITETGQTIDNSYLSQDDLTFSKEYFINSVVFSRAEESDNYYKQDTESIEENGLSEYRLSDLQILSVSDRSKFMNEIYDYLIDLRFWIFDIKSTGIFVFEPADLFTIETDDNSYSVLCLNSEGVVEQGLTEQIYADEPDESETDYTASTSEEKADRTTRILVNKVEKEISALVEEVSEYENKTTKLELSLEEIESTVKQISIFTRELTQVENLYLNDAAEGQGYILSFIIYGNTNYFTEKDTVLATEEDENILTESEYELEGDTNYYIRLCVSKQPRGYGNALYLSTENEEELLMEDEEQIIIGAGSFYVEYVDIKLTDILRSYTDDEGNNYYDTLEVSNDGTITLTRRIGVDEEGNQYLLDEETVEVLDETIILPSSADGYYYFIENYSYLTYYAKYITQNDYMDYFASKVELNTAITQTATEIELMVSSKVDETEIISKINMSSENIAIQANKISLNGYISNDEGSFIIDEDGNASFSSGAVSINQDGIQLADGSSLVGGEGIYTNLVFTTDTKLLGLSGYGTGSNAVEYLSIFAQIPENFTIKKAYITIRHQPVSWDYTEDGETYSSVTGYARNVQIYANSEYPYTSFQAYSDYSSITEMQGTKTTALGSSGKTFSSTATETVTSSDLSSYLTAGDFIQFDIGTTASADTVTSQGYACARCGIAIAQLQVIGYLTTEA